MNEIKTRFQVPPLQVRDRVTVFAGNQGKTGAPGLCDRESEGVGGSQRESEDRAKRSTSMSHPRAPSRGLRPSVDSEFHALSCTQGDG